MSSIGPDFGISKNTGHQETRATAPTSTTLQALGSATALQVLTAHHSLPDCVPTPPRFELEMLGNFVAFKMEGVKDGLFHTSDYKKAVFKLFFGVEFVSPVKSAALDFAHAFMAEAARYGIDGQVFCKAAGTVLPFDTFVTFVFICISHACGPQKEAVKGVHHDKVRANVEFILAAVAKARADEKHLILADRHFRLQEGLAYSFGKQKTAAEASALASNCLMVEVALHHLTQLQASENLGDLVLAAKLISCLRSMKVSKSELAEQIVIEAVIEKLAKHAEGAIDDSVFDQCAEAATALLSVSPEPAHALLFPIAELRAANAELRAMGQLNAVMDWFKEQGLTTVGGVDKRGNFAFGPYPGTNGSFDIERHGPKAFELAEAWALNPYADMARVTAILDYLQKRLPERLDQSHPLLVANEKLKARLAASPVPAVKDRAKLL